MQTKKSLWKRKGFWWTAVIVVILIFAGVAFTRDNAVIYETEAVRFEPIQETVNVTGQIKPEVSANLRFKISGIIDSLTADVGDSVKRGERLARLDASNLRKELLRKEAELNAAKVALANAEQDREDTLVKNSQALGTVYKNAPKNFADILTKSEKAYTTFESFYTEDLNDLLISIQRSVNESQKIADANNMKFVGDQAIIGLRLVLQTFSRPVTEEKMRETIEAIEAPLANLRSALATLGNAIDAIELGFEVSQATLETYKSAMTTAQINLNDAIALDATIEKDLDDAIINSGLNLSSVDATIRASEASVKTAEAAVEIATQNLRDASLYSPINGVVTIRNKEIGELVTANDEVFVVIGESDLEITANIPEVDIGLVAVGNTVLVTLDALTNDEVFTATVESIDPDQTTIDGVVYYKTHMKFDEEDPRFKSGMSTDLDIIVAEKDRALVVPRRAVSRRSGASIVRVYQGPDMEPEERIVTTGLRSDLMIEVIDGLTEGEEVVVGEE